MDFIAIIEHNWSIQQLLTLPSVIDQTPSLQRIYASKNHVKRPSPSVPKTSAKWEGKHPMTPNNLNTIWQHTKDDKPLALADKINHDATISTFFGSLTVNEATVSIGLFPEHKYGNLQITRVLEFILEINRAIATLLRTKKIVYCCDSYYYPSILEEKAREGWTLEAIIEFGNQHFGVPPKEINAAVANLYFIDDFDLLPEGLDSEKKVWSRAKYEYDLQQKDEQPPYGDLWS